MKNMKKVVYLLVILFSSFGCSSDNNSNSNNKMSLNENNISKQESICDKNRFENRFENKNDTIVTPYYI